MPAAVDVLPVYGIITEQDIGENCSSPASFPASRDDQCT